MSANVDGEDATHNGNQAQNGGLYPPHFEKGALIQLASGDIKCVQDLSIEDFQRSTELSPDLKLDSSQVVKLDENAERTMALLCFVVGEDKLPITVEAPAEHPFFVYGKGWSSVRPEMSSARYKLSCHSLVVGDVCASLTNKGDITKATPSTHAVNEADVPMSTSPADAQTPWRSAGNDPYHYPPR